MFVRCVFEIMDCGCLVCVCLIVCVCVCVCVCCWLWFARCWLAQCVELPLNGWIVVVLLICLFLVLLEFGCDDSVLYIWV